MVLVTIDGSRNRCVSGSFLKYSVSTFFQISHAMSLVFPLKAWGNCISPIPPLLCARSGSRNEGAEFKNTLRLLKNAALHDFCVAKTALKRRVASLNYVRLRGYFPLVHLRSAW